MTPVRVLVPTCGGANTGLEESVCAGTCPTQEIMGLSKGLDRGLTLQPLSQASV